VRSPRSEELPLGSDGPAVDTTLEDVEDAGSRRALCAVEAAQAVTILHKLENEHLPAGLGERDTGSYRRIHNDGHVWCAGAPQ
jgi:hypothetical protein